MFVSEPQAHWISSYFVRIQDYWLQIPPTLLFDLMFLQLLLLTITLFASWHFNIWPLPQTVTTSIGGQLGRWRPTGPVVRSRLLDCFPLYIRVFYRESVFRSGWDCFCRRPVLLSRCREVRSPEVRAPVVTAVLLCSSQQSASIALRGTPAERPRPPAR